MLKKTFLSLAVGVLLSSTTLAALDERGSKGGLARQGAPKCTFGFGGNIGQNNVTVKVDYVLNHHKSLVVEVTATPTGAETSELEQRLNGAIRKDVLAILDKRQAAQKTITQYQSSVDILTQAFTVASALSFATIEVAKVGSPTLQPLRNVLKNIDAFIAIIRTIGTNEQCTKTIQARTQALVNSLAPPANVALAGTLLDKVLAGTPLKPTAPSTDLISVGYGVKLGPNGGAGGGFTIGPKYEVGGGFNIGVPGTGIGGGFKCGHGHHHKGGLKKVVGPSVFKEHRKSCRFHIGGNLLGSTADVSVDILPTFIASAHLNVTSNFIDLADLDAGSMLTGAMGPLAEKLVSSIRSATKQAVVAKKQHSVKPAPSPTPDRRGPDEILSLLTEILDGAAKTFAILMALAVLIELGPSVLLPLQLIIDALAAFLFVVGSIQPILLSQPAIQDAGISLTQTVLSATGVDLDVKLLAKVLTGKPLSAEEDKDDLIKIGTGLGILPATEANVQVSVGAQGQVKGGSELRVADMLLMGGEAGLRCD
ncbi:hypothetical protein OC846_001081 [Tilletia horrida]|uniref:Uncharacterized protein n=1 Tax=Tilletia horrida TaxID=155126 RepID=A0AAN6GTK7_9BASI|nr:hypothetical protein OC846_001081 [Tilletia horrida]KAK0569343.1 hypothetical protein OC861_001057 [Tilletia horrida]